MATAPKQNLGKMPCPERECSGAVAVYRSAPGTLSWKCHEMECGASGFSAAHEKAAQRWLEKLGASAPAVPPAVKKAAAVPVVPPVVKKPVATPPAGQKTGFSMGGL